MREVARKFLRLTSPAMGAALLAAGVILLWPHATSAQYVSNNLIDDNIFLNAASMSQPQIQTFLTNRAGYLATYQLVFDCASTGTASNSAYVSAGAPCGQTVPASTIIYYAAQVYGVNPQVILATLQKEQSLVTDPSPVAHQLSFAMGYGCGDSTGCSQDSGFLHQVDDATWQLRLNFERSWGNNNWWSSQYTYACPGATKYYSTGLFPGRNVTFFDDSGTGYASFVLNDGATASLYCYTPHAYPGSAKEYYSGSYNFVTSFEQWFGSTQPAVELTSNMTLSTDSAGHLYTGPVTASFTLTNTTNGSVNVGQIGVAGYDSADDNVGFPSQTVVIPAHGTYTYTETQTLSKEDTYNFWITDLVGGVWSSTYPASANIDYVRNTSMFVQAMPVITTQPTLTSTTQRAGKAASASFTVHNPSAQAVNLGKIGLAIYAADGTNYGTALASETIAAGQDYTYTSPIGAWQSPGQYTVWVTDTQDNGASYNDTTFPAAASDSINRRITFTVLPSPTITQQPTLSIGSPHVGQQVNASFVIHNYGDSTVSAGQVGLAIYGPQGQNVGLPLVNLSVGSNSDLSYQQSATFTTPGVYTAWITVYRNGLWDNTNYPTPDSGSVQRQITFTVLPSPTVTIQPTLTPAQPRVGQEATATYTIKNYGDTSVWIGQTGLAAYDSAGRNFGFALENVTVPANSTYTYSENSVFTGTGTYSAWITVTQNGGKTWDDTTYPAADNGSISRKISFTVLPSPTLTQGPTLSIGSPHVGQQVNASFVIHNYGDSTVSAGQVGLAIYGPQGQNVGLSMANLNVAANSDLTYQQPTTFNIPGTYTAYVTVYRNGLWDNTAYPPPDGGSVQRQITFTVLPN